jgi:hypothetical protein
LAFTKSESRRNLIVSSYVRWLAVATGCFAAAAGSFGFGLGFALMPSILIVGAIIQPRFPRAGRGLICAGALWLSFWVFDVGVLMMLEHRPTDRPGVVSLILCAVVLVALCDLAILMEEIKIRKLVKNIE